ncbi:MAG: hypothetical protein K0R39_5164 [Symbiobacteriaceae bacterium]|jgi:hypothetical protein|nr:hypothetical protein [Symbiobacteriaceae bacterium]
MPKMKNSDKMLTDAKAATTSAVTFGLETGQAPIDEAHTVQDAAFNTGALYRGAPPADPGAGQG